MTKRAFWFLGFVVCVGITLYWVVSLFYTHTFVHILITVVAVLVTVSIGINAFRQVSRPSQEKSIRH